MISVKQICDRCKTESRFLYRYNQRVIDRFYFLFLEGIERRSTKVELCPSCNKAFFEYSKPICGDTNEMVKP